MSSKNNNNRNGIFYNLMDLLSRSYYSIATILATFLFSWVVLKFIPDRNAFFMVFGSIMLTLIVVYNYLSARVKTARLKYEARIYQLESERQNSFLSGLLKALPEWVRVVDTKGNVKYQNPIMTKNLGNIHPCWRLFHMKRCNNCTSEEAVKTRETQRRIVSTGSKSYLITSSPIIEANNMVEGVVEVITDITQIQSLKHSLELSIENRGDGEVLKQLISSADALENITQAVAIVNPETDEFTYANQMFSRLFGLEQSFKELKPTELFKIKEIPRNAKEIGNVEYPKYKFTFKPFSNANNDRVLVIIDDISHLTHLSERLHQEEDMVYRIVESLKAGIVVINRDRKIKWKNKYVDKFFGDTGIINCFNLFGCDTACPDCPLESIFANGKRGIQTYVLYHQLLDKYFRINLNHLQNGEDGALMIIFDVTAEEKSKQEKARLFGDSISGVERLERATTDLRQKTTALHLAVVRRKNGTEKRQSNLPID